jgi:hypothetical protein
LLGSMLDARLGRWINRLTIDLIMRAVSSSQY